MSQETWSEIAGYPQYAVSSQGNVRRKAYVTQHGHNRRERQLVPIYREFHHGKKAEGGYVKLFKDGAASNHFVCDLVAAAFLPRFDQGYHKILYRDDDPKNLAASNLYIMPKSLSRLQAKINSALLFG